MSCATNGGEVYTSLDAGESWTVQPPPPGGTQVYALARGSILYGVAAGIVAASLALLGVLILATMPLFARKRKPQAPNMLAAGGEGVGMLDQGVGKAMQSVGPVTLLSIAFIAGLLASRRK